MARNGLDAVEYVYNAIKDCGLPGWMDKKETSATPPAFFVVSHISTGYNTLLSRIPVNVNIYFKKTGSGMIQRDLMNTTAKQIQSLIGAHSQTGILFYTQPSISGLILDEKDYDIFNIRYDVVITS